MIVIGRGQHSVVVGRLQSRGTEGEWEGLGDNCTICSGRHSHIVILLQEEYRTCVPCSDR